MASIQSRIQDLGDLELAILLSRVAEEHCILSTSHGFNKPLQEELRRILNDTFSLRPALIECTAKTTVDDFNEALLQDADDDDLDDAAYDTRVIDKPAFSVDFSPSKQRSPSRFGSVANTFNTRKVANVIIATNLDRASESVQVQALELLRTKRIFTRSAMHTAPKDLLFITILSHHGARLSHHLNDLFALSHFHPVEGNEDESLPHLSAHHQPAISHEDLTTLRAQTASIPLSAELAQYLHNLTIFLRASRYVKSGVTATATRQLRTLSRALAPLHGIDFVTPSLVALAVRKVYPHRLVLTTVEDERTLQWGSERDAVAEALRGVGVGEVVEMVLGDVEAPL